MARLVANKYYGRNGDVKINSYMLALPKSLVKESGIQPDKVLVMEAEDGKIIIREEDIEIENNSKEKV